jgi:hypothetical protein
VPKYEPGEVSAQQCRLGGALAEANRLVIANVEKLKGGVPGKVQSQVIPTIFEVVVVLNGAVIVYNNEPSKKRAFLG